MNALTDSPDEAALLRGVLDAPDDDLPRLVYADWLEEHGGERERHHARVIRAMTSAPEGGAYFVDTGRHTNFSYLFGRPGEEHFEFEAVVHTVLGRGATPPRPVRTIVVGRAGGAHFDVHTSTPSVTWHGGFVARVTLTELSFFGHAEGLSRHPLVEVTLFDKDPTNWRLDSPRPFYFSRADPTESSYSGNPLAARLFDRMRQAGPRHAGGSDAADGDDRTRPVLVYPDERTARQAVSSACLAHLRSLRT